MALSPGSRRRDPNLPSGEPLRDETTLNPMQEPLGSMERPIPRTSDENDVNLGAGSGRRSTSTMPDSETRGRGFTATFAIIAAVLAAAFLIALYMGTDNRSNIPVAGTSQGTTDDATGSTSPPPPAPDTTGNATKAPATP